MKRNTPIKDKIYKTEIYLKHKRLINKLASTYMRAIDSDFEDLVSEFNVVFCEAIRRYHPEKGCFSTLLTNCCKNYIYNKIKANKHKKNTAIKMNDFFIDGELIQIQDYLSDGIDLLEKVILHDNFNNNKNPIIKSITGIISTYKLPDKGFKNWLRSILISYGYNHIEIQKAFNIIKTLY